MRTVHNQSKLVCGVEGCTKVYMSICGLYNHKKTIHSSRSKDLKPDKARLTRDKSTEITRGIRRTGGKKPFVKESRKSLTLKPFGMEEQEGKASTLNHEDEAIAQIFKIGEQLPR